MVKITAFLTRGKRIRFIVSETQAGVKIKKKKKKFKLFIFIHIKIESFNTSDIWKTHKQSMNWNFNWSETLTRVNPSSACLNWGGGKRNHIHRWGGLRREIKKWELDTDRWWERGSCSACSSIRTDRIRVHRAPRPHSSTCASSASASLSLSRLLGFCLCYALYDDEDTRKREKAILSFDIPKLGKLH